MSHLSVQKLADRYRHMPVTVKAALAYTICSIVQRSLSLITVPLFTRLLSTAEYGQVNVYGSWQGIMAVIITLQVPFDTFSAAMVKYQDRRDAYTSCVQVFCVAMGMAALAVIAIFEPWFSTAFELPGWIIKLMVLEITANAAIYCWFARERYEFRYRPVVFLTLVQSVISIIFSVLSVLNSSERGYARIAGNSFASILFGAAVFLLCLYRGRKIFEWEFVKYILGFNLPLLPYYLSQIIFNSSDRIMISSLKSSSEAGIYGIAHSLGMLLSFVLSAVLNVFQPWFFSRIADGTAAQKKRITTLIALGMAVLVLGILMAAPEIILVMVGKAYREAVWAVPPIAASLYAYYCASIFLYLDFYHEKKACMNAATILAAAVNVGLNWILIPHFGFLGAAYTTLFSYLVFEAVAYYSYRRILKQYGCQEELFEDNWILGIQAALSAAGFGILFLYRWFWIRMAFLVLVVILILWKKNKIIQIYRQLREHGKL